MGSISKKPAGQHRIRLPFHLQVLGTLGCVLLYRLLSSIPLPSADRDALAVLMAGRSFGMLDVLSGGSIARVSVATLGISPYVSASIIMQLLGAVVPVVSLLQRSGPVGRKKIREATLGLSAVVAVLSGTMLASGYRQAGILPSGFWTGLAVPVLLMAGCAVGMAAVGCYIDEKLFGSGVSILIMAGALSSLPSALALGCRTAGSVYGTAGTAAFAVGALAFGMMVFWLVNCRVELKLSYSGKFSGGSDLDGISVLPIVALPGGVMPVIFASYFLSVPSMFQGLTGEVPGFVRALDMQAWFDPDEPLLTLGALAYAVLIFVFGRLSQIMSVNGAELAENLRRGGCTVEGVPAGPDTERYVSERIRAMTNFGSMGLCFVAIIPAAISSILEIPSMGYIGTTVLLVVSVMQDVLSEADAELRSIGYMRCMPLMLKGPRSGNPFALLEKARNAR